jgi:hypothetical protein
VARHFAGEDGDLSLVVGEINLQRVEQAGDMAFGELHVHDGADDRDDFAFCCHGNTPG